MVNFQISSVLTVHDKYMYNVGSAPTNIKDFWFGQTNLRGSPGEAPTAEVIKNAVAGAQKRIPLFCVVQALLVLFIVLRSCT